MKKERPMNTIQLRKIEQINSKYKKNNNSGKKQKNISKNY